MLIGFAALIGIPLAIAACALRVALRMLSAFPASFGGLLRVIGKVTGIFILLLLCIAVVVVCHSALLLVTGRKRALASTVPDLKI
jgi:hypothetical protein